MAKSDYQKGIYNQLLDVMARLDAVEKDLRNEKTEHRDDVIRLNAQIDGLTRENQLLRDDNERLKSIINNDSSNTSQPPSTDQKGGKPANTYSGRTKTGKKPGAQKGHTGSTLSPKDIEEKIRKGVCRHEVRCIGGSGNGPYVTRYVVDLDVKPVITEIRIYADENGKYPVPPQYRSAVTYGGNVKSLAVALYSEGVMANDRIAEFLNAASGGGLELSAGSVYNFCRELADKSQLSIARLEEHLLAQRVVCTDATVVTVNGEQNYIRNFSIQDTVLYRAMKSKAIGAMKKISFLSQYTGILEHDHETALYHFGTRHGECNVHILRYLRKNTEDTGHQWSGEMIRLLNEMNRDRKKQMADGCGCFQEESIADYERRYDELLRKGRKENPGTEHTYAKKDEKTLLNRMEKYRDNHLLFLRDFEVPFDDNMSERDLRKAKNRQKMAGGFRKHSGNEMYCSILTIIETLKRRDMGLIENINKLFMGTPAIF